MVTTLLSAGCYFTVPLQHILSVFEQRILLYVVQSGLIFGIILSLLLIYWDYRHAAPYLAFASMLLIYSWLTL